tara:strand:+ start:142 stop:747 length:606 start_codon:yes stop_codon:yes gene_type:complete
MSTQITPTTELQAVNIMLSTIGEAPVNTIEGTTNVDVSIAKAILNETSMSIQTEGWNFNTVYNKAVSKDIDNKVPLPSNCVQADANKDDRHLNVIIRGGYLYDVDNDTDVFSATVPLLDLVLVQQFEDLPEYARRYITMKSARRFAARFIGETELTQLAQLDEQEAMLAFKLADSRSEDNNLLTSDANTYSIINRPPRRRY